jgi:hypothetical protein
MSDQLPGPHRERQRRASSYGRRETRQLTEAAISPTNSTINQSMI